MIFVDSNVPMYLVGAPHPNKDRTIAVLTRLVRDGEQFVTSVEVYQEILHRYTAIRRLNAIDAAFESLDAIADDVLTFGMSEVRAARSLIDSIHGLSARDASPRGRDACSRSQSYPELRRRIRRLPRHRSSELTCHLDAVVPRPTIEIPPLFSADRSIALVDLALRRRFYFVEFHPDEDPVKGVLRRWLLDKSPGMEWVADVVERANEHLREDRHAAIGPSYFMKDGLDEETVQRIWKHSVLPYIEERLYGQQEEVEKFTLDSLKAELV